MEILEIKNFEDTVAVNQFHQVAFNTFKGNSVWAPASEMMFDSKLDQYSKSVYKIMVPVFRKRKTKGSPLASFKIGSVFDISQDNADEILKEMTEKGLIHGKKAGNGKFYSLPQNLTVCDSLTGNCS